MPIDRNLGKRCRYADTCPLFDGIGIPENRTQQIWRNVFCYRGTKGWNNCAKYKSFEDELPSQ
jgi:hypothetical protein